MSELDALLAKLADDDNEWWRLPCGGHLNAFEDAIDRMRAAEAAVKRVADLAWDFRNAGTASVYESAVEIGQMLDDALTPAQPAAPEEPA